jgi:hypothetical protein
MRGTQVLLKLDQVSCSEFLSLLLSLQLIIRSDNGEEKETCLDDCKQNRRTYPLNFNKPTHFGRFIVDSLYIF